MLYQANMPKSFWAEAMTTAAYLINRLPSEAIEDEIPYEKWYQKQLPISDLQALKSFGCIVHIHVPKERQKASSKVDTQSTTGCFVGYTKTNTMWKVWDFERKLFVNSRDVIFFETEFPKASDFDEPPADPYDRSTPFSSPEPVPRPIFDEIVVQPPPALRAFKTYGDFQPDSPSFSFIDAMRRPDAKLRWDAFCDEITAIIARKTWSLVHLPPGRRALPLRWVCKRNTMQQMFSRNTKAALLLKDLHKKLNWISIRRSPLSSELTLYAHFSPSALQTIFASSKSTAKTPSSTVKATSRSTSNNLKDSLTPIILMPY